MIKCQLSHRAKIEDAYEHVAVAAVVISMNLHKNKACHYIVDNLTKAITVELSGSVRDGPIYIACHVFFTRLLPSSTLSES